MASASRSTARPLRVGREQEFRIRLRVSSRNGALGADFDQDGDRDALALDTAGGVVLLVQEQAGDFFDQTVATGLHGLAGATLAGWRNL